MREWWRSEGHWLHLPPAPASVPDCFLPVASLPSRQGGTCLPGMGPWALWSPLLVLSTSVAPDRCWLLLGTCWIGFVHSWFVQPRWSSTCLSQTSRHIASTSGEGSESMLMEQCCCSVAKPCLTLCHLVDWCTPGSSIRLYLPKFDQIHVH